MSDCQLESLHWHIFSGRTFRIVVAGIQCVSKSYSLARTCKILAGERSSIMSLAMTSIRASQSGGGMGVFSEIWSLQIGEFVSKWNHQVASHPAREMSLQDILTSEHAPPHTSTTPSSNSSHTPSQPSPPAQHRPSNPPYHSRSSARPRSPPLSAPRL